MPDERARPDEEIEKEQDQQGQEYEEPSLTDLEDVSGGHTCITGGSQSLDES